MLSPNRIEADCGRPSRKSAKSKPVAWPVKLSVPRPFGSLVVFQSLRVYCPPKVNECVPCTTTRLSLPLWLWLRVSTGLPSESEAKFDPVKFRLGGPKLRGLLEVPWMPSCCATSEPLAKNGVLWFRLRLKVTRAVLTSVGEKVRVQPRSVVMPLPLLVSRKPNACCASPSRR